MAGTDQKSDYLFKIILLGDTAVGKSSIVARYTHNTFDEELKATIGVEFGAKTIVLEDKIIKAQIWDTAGQEKFGALTRYYYQGVSGSLMVYDITNKESFEHIREWNSVLMQNTENTTIKILIGNKSDLKAKREVKTETAVQYAQSEGMAFLETSALESTNVDMAFERLVSEIYKLHVHPDSPPTIRFSLAEKSSMAEKGSIKLNAGKEIRGDTGGMSHDTTNSEPNSVKKSGKKRGGGGCCTIF